MKLFEATPVSAQFDEPGRALPFLRPAPRPVRRASGGARRDAVKRGLDVVAAALLLVMTTPAIVLAMAVVRLSSRGPAIYSQRRVGRYGREFTIFKLRTMQHNCERLSGPKWCVPGDTRITPVGRVLRKLHIDELPQLWNVLRGDMSLIGPRPERPEFVTRLAAVIPGYNHRHVVLPGITGLAQIQLSADTDFLNVACKLRFDLHYVRHGSLWLDVRILAGTVLKVLGVSVEAMRGWMGMDHLLHPAPIVLPEPPRAAAA